MGHALPGVVRQLEGWRAAKHTELKRLPERTDRERLAALVKRVRGWRGVWVGEGQGLRVGAGCVGRAVAVTQPLLARPRSSLRLPSAMASPFADLLLGLPAVPLLACQLCRVQIHPASV